MPLPSWLTNLLSGGARSSQNRAKVQSRYGAKPNATEMRYMNQYKIPKPSFSSYGNPRNNYSQANYKIPKPVTKKKFVNPYSVPQTEGSSYYSHTLWEMAQGQRQMDRQTAAPAPTYEGNYSDYYGGGGGGGGGWGWGGGGGGYGEAPKPAPITWSEFKSGVGGAPAWWKAMKPSAINEGDEDTQYVMALNMMIPFLSPEDQKTAASTIYQINAKDFGHLNPEKIDVKPALSLDTDLIKQFTSSDRANRALAAMTELAGAVGKKDSELGPGYRYLRSILDTVGKFGATGIDRQTPKQYQNMLAALDPLYGQSKTGALSIYGSLAKMLAQPFFSGGQLFPMEKAADGTYVFGTGNATLY